MHGSTMKNSISRFYDCWAGYEAVYILPEELLYLTAGELKSKSDQLASTMLRLSWHPRLGQ